VQDGFDGEPRNAERDAVLTMRSRIASIKGSTCHSMCRSSCLLSNASSEVSHGTAMM